MAKRKPGRPKTRGPKRSVVLSIRLTPGERRLLGKASGEYPPGIWARVQLMRAVEQALEKGGKR